MSGHARLLGAANNLRVHVKGDFTTMGDAVTRYCKAQAEINAVAEASRSQEQEVKERIRTFRTLLQEQLEANQMTCCEVIPPGCKDPVFVRLTRASKPPQISPKLLLCIMRAATEQDLAARADECGHDLPKMLTAIVADEIRKTTNDQSTKSKLVVSKSKERGHTATAFQPPAPIQRLTQDLIGAQTQMQELSATCKTKKEPHIQEQQLVEKEVKGALAVADPVTRTQRVHMVQGDAESVFYLRCKEVAQRPSLGVRKALPIVEATVAESLQGAGMPRNFEATGFRPAQKFWVELEEQLGKKIDEASQPSSVTKLTMERGARQRRRAARNGAL
jgi:hypothetical protein